MTHAAEQTSPAWKRGKLSYGAGLTLDTAKKMLEAGVTEAGKLGMPMVIAITDAGGNLLAFNRMDNAMLVSIQIAIDKAFTAVFGKRPTENWASSFREGPLIPLFVHERLITFPGGFPIIDKGVILGGVGASGGLKYEDVHVARAALKAGGFSLDDVDAAIAELEGMEKE